MNLIVRSLTLVQIALGLRVIARLIRTAHGTRISRNPQSETAERVTVLLPVLNERARLAPCLRGLAAQEDIVPEILVIDGGSTDGTPELVHVAARDDKRIRLIDATPVPDGVNGKAWNLQKGLEAAGEGTAWILTIDADVRPDPDVVTSLLAHASKQGVPALSAATGQQLSGAGEALLHPSMLTTLVYRFGIPGHATTDPAMIQANGQCFLVRRDLLEARGGFADLLDTTCEDVTLARSLATAGHPVGFYETDGLVTVEMYRDWHDAWANWTRSLPMLDRYSTISGVLGLAEILFVQALPLWIAPVATVTLGRNAPLSLVNTMLLITRLGVLQGIGRAYEQRPWTYWISPVTDLPVALRILMMARRRQHTWRGRTFTTGVSR